MSGATGARNEPFPDPEERNRLTLPAHAKVNLRLRVLGRMEDGYHSVESLYLALDLHDDVEVSSGEGGLRLEVSGDPSIPADESNLAWRAADDFFAEIGEEADAAIRLVKRIPAGAGLGGGSADAAAVLTGLNELHGGPLAAKALFGLADNLGSDVPFAVSGAAFALGWGRGQRLLPLTAPPARPALVLVPDFPVATGEAYAWLREDREAGGPAPAGSSEPDPRPGAILLPRAGELMDWEALADVAHNDFERPVFARHPRLGPVRDALGRAGAHPALLCGSGSAVVGIFESEARRDAAAEQFATGRQLGTIATATCQDPEAASSGFIHLA